MSLKTVEEYVQFLQGKGFQFQEDARGFIEFGQQYTNAPDELVNFAIELTLKIQKSFDGSFYVSLLEMLMTQKITTRREAIKYIQKEKLFNL